MYNLYAKIGYGLLSGLVYAGFLALIDYFRNKDFDLTKFIIGALIFGLAMIIASKINAKKIRNRC